MLNWFKTTIKKIGFEDVKKSLDSTEKILIINTLPTNEQQCLIKNTIPYNEEESIINKLLDSYNVKQPIIIYGKNSCDESAETKYKQITGLGFVEVYLYSGGLFEWMLLQDIYGEHEFPTTKKVIDILKYRPQKLFS